MRHGFQRRKGRDLRMVDPCRSSSQRRLHHPSASGSGDHLRGTARRRARCRRSSRSTRSFIAATGSSQNSTTSASIRTGSQSICSSSRTRISKRRPPLHGYSRRARGMWFIAGHALASASRTGGLPAAKPPSPVISTLRKTTGASRPSPSSRWPVAAGAHTAGNSAFGCFPYRPPGRSRCTWRYPRRMPSSRRSSSTVASCARRPNGRGSSGADGQRVRSDGDASPAEDGTAMGTRPRVWFQLANRPAVARLWPVARFDRHPRSGPPANTPATTWADPARAGDGNRTRIISLGS